MPQQAHKFDGTSSTRRLVVIRDNHLYLPFQKLHLPHMCVGACNYLLTNMLRTLRRWAEMPGGGLPDGAYLINVADIPVCSRGACSAWGGRRVRVMLLQPAPCCRASEAMTATTWQTVEWV